MNTEIIRSMKEKSIDEIEKMMLSLPQAECPVFHKFGDGLYIRELHMKAGTLAIGHEQRFKHYNVMLKGKVKMLNSDGSTSELSAPAAFFAEPGRKIGYVIEDMVWQNIYPTCETDIETLENIYLNKSEAWKLNNELQMSLLTLEREKDREDFKQALEEIGVSPELVTSQSENEEDRIQFYNNRTRVAESPIQGKGLFATTTIPANEIILPARIGGMRTDAGRYTNHSANPNARMEGDENGDIWLISMRNIKGCLGGELGEEITVDYRQAIKENLRIGGASCQQLPQQV